MNANLLSIGKIATSLAFLAIGGASANVSAQTKTSLVIASVTDAQSGQPLADAEVRLSDLNLSGTTDWSGEARIAKVAGGQHQFEVRKMGYDPMLVTLAVQGDSIGPVFRLAKTTTPVLEPVKVEGDAGTTYLAEFEKRRAEGHGRYLTAADLEKKQNRSLVAVLANAFSGLMSTPDPERAGHNLLTTRRTRPRLDRVDVHCGVDIYLDGSQYLDDLDALRPTELAGVEYYQTESAPGEYRKLTDNCGVLLLWSKK